MATPRLMKSVKLYQERKQPANRTTRRSPGFHHDLSLNAAHTLPLSAPYPTSEVRQIEAGNAGLDCGCGDPAAEHRHPPDGLLTTPWLHGSEELS